MHAYAWSPTIELRSPPADATTNQAGAECLHRELQRLEAGAVDYIVKPFSAKQGCAGLPAHGSAVCELPHHRHLQSALSERMFTPQCSGGTYLRHAAGQHVVG